MASHRGLALVAALAGLSSCVFVNEPLTTAQDSDEDSATDTGAADTGTDTGEPETHPCGPLTAFVSEIIDGDTIEINTGDRVRYLLIDTPEISGDSGAECWGPQATEYNRMLVEDRNIHLEYDAVCRDQYNRLLAYITVDELDGFEVNRAMLENGYACVLHIPPNGNARVAEFQGLEDTAKADEVGMWSACGTVACDF